MGTASQRCSGRGKGGVVVKALCIALTLASCSCGMRPVSLPQSDMEFIDSYFEGVIDSGKLKFFESDHTEHLAYAIGNSVVFNDVLNIESSHMRHRDILVHELVHVWQWEHLKVAQGPKGYAFGLYDFDTLEEYGTEQQATIVEAHYQAISGLEIPLECLDCGLYEIDTVIERLTELKEQVR